MGIASLDIKNNLYVNHNEIVNIQDFNSEKLSVINNNNNNNNNKKHMSIMITIHFFGYFYE